MSYCCQEMQNFVGVFLRNWFSSYPRSTRLFLKCKGETSKNTCTDLLRSYKLVRFADKILSHLTPHLIQNVMYVVLKFKTFREWPKNSSIQNAFKNRVYINLKVSKGTSI